MYSLQEIKDAFSAGKKMNNSNGGEYNQFANVVKMTGDYTEQLGHDGKVGGNVFKSEDGIIAEIDATFRGFNIPATIFKTSDDKLIVFL